MYNPHQQDESGYEGADLELVLTQYDMRETAKIENDYEMEMNDEMSQRDWRCKNV